MVRKFFIAVNPKSGRYDEYIIDGYLQDFLTGSDITGEIYRFSNRSDFKERIERAKRQGFDHFIAAGGDGMISILASSLNDNKYPIGIIPSGTSNILANVLGIPVDIRRALQLIARSEDFRIIDALRIGAEMYFMNASTGFSSSLIEGLDSEKKSMLGIFAYLLSGVRSLRKVTEYQFSITIDGNTFHEKAVEVFIANIGALGASYYTVSNSNFNDGVFEVCAVNKASFKAFINILLDLLNRYQKKSIHLIGQGKTATITTEKVLPVQADGDIIGETPFTVEIIPEAATFIVPKQREYWI